MAQAYRVFSHIAETATHKDLPPPSSIHSSIHPKVAPHLLPLTSTSTIYYSNLINMASATAQRRLLQEYRALTNNPPDGITAGPVSEDDLLYWEALIQGPEGTPFEGGVFAAELKFPKDYPLAPPSMRFLGEIWHPNGLCSSFRAVPHSRISC